jgi:hypothetical protein
LRYLLLLLMFQPLCTLADTPPATFMHRIDAGTFDARGWAVAESTNGGFAVQMPGPFNDFSVAGDPDGIADRIEGVGGKAPNGIVFTALKLVYKSPATAKEEFAKFKSGEGLPSPKISPAVVSGLDALDISFADEKSATNERIIIDGESIFTLTVEWPTDKSVPALAMYLPFLESFKLLPKVAPRLEDPGIWQHEQLNETFMRTLTKELCMKKTIATLSRYGCATKQCLVNVGGATADCITWAKGDKAEFCATYDNRYVTRSCGAGGLDQSRCELLDAIRRGTCAPPPAK